MVGQLPHSATAIGAASLGSASFYAFAIFGIGLMSGLDTLVSQAFGAHDLPAARRAFASSLVLALAVAPALAASILGLTPLLGLLGVTPAVKTDAISFARILVLSLPLLLLYTCLRRYLQGIHYVRPTSSATGSSSMDTGVSRPSASRARPSPPSSLSRAGRGAIHLLLNWHPSAKSSGTSDNTNSDDSRTTSQEQPRSDHAPRRRVRGR